MTIAAILGHQGGWDEIALVAAPIAVIVFLLVLADEQQRRRERIPQGFVGGGLQVGRVAHDPEQAMRGRTQESHVLWLAQSDQDIGGARGLAVAEGHIVGAVRHMGVRYAVDDFDVVAAILEGGGKADHGLFLPADGTAQGGVAVVGQG